MRTFIVIPTRQGFWRFTDDIKTIETIIQNDKWISNIILSTIDE